MGLEIALSYRRLGCEVSVIEAGMALAETDPELAEIALRQLRAEGVALYEGASIGSVHARSQGIGVVVRTADGNVNLDASHILVAPARLPSLADLGLDVAGIRLDKDGALRLSHSLRTSNHRVYAVGEAMRPGVVHDVATEADIVVRAALLRQPVRYEPAAVPRLVLTDPEICEVGLNEQMARARFKTAFDIVRVGYAESDRARSEREGMGVIKLIVGRTGALLGAGLVGPAAGELAGALALAIAQRLKVADLAGVVAPYPSYSSLIRALGEAAAAKSGPRTLDARLLGLNRLLP
jgi:pyruvate/2-oxoglutarate dehydrogenase complex dihydrolipoamide dehydrogenase (E3) component